MPNMDPKKCPMPVQDPEVRNKNFNEVALGYTYDMAVNEAKRCLHLLPKWPKRIWRALIRFCLPLPRCPLFADVSAPRKTSARANVCAASRPRA